MRRSTSGKTATSVLAAARLGRTASGWRAATYKGVVMGRRACRPRLPLARKNPQFVVLFCHGSFCGCVTNLRRAARADGGAPHQFMKGRR